MKRVFLTKSLFYTFFLILNNLFTFITYNTSTAIAETNIKTTYKGISLSCHVEVAYKMAEASDKVSWLVQMANLYASAKQESIARKLLDDASVSVISIPHLDDQAQAFINIALGYAQIGKFYEARQLLTKASQNILLVENKIYTLEGLGFTSNSKENLLSSLAEAYVQARLPERGLQIVASLDENLRPIILSKIVSIYLQHKQYATAIKTAKTIKNTSYQSEALLDIANFDIQARRYAQALRIIKSMPDLGMRSQSLAMIAKEYAIMGQRLKGEKIFKQAVDIAKTVSERASGDSRAFKRGVFYFISIKYAESGFYTEALDIVNTQLKPGYTYYLENLQVQDDTPNLQIEALSRIATELGVQGKNQQAIDIFEQVIEIAQVMDNPSAKASILADIASSLAKGGFFERAIELANSPEIESYKSNALFEIALAALNNNKIDLVLDIYKSIAPSTYYKDKITYDMLAYFSENKKYQQAKSLVSQLSEVSEQQRWLQLLDCNYRGAGKDAGKISI